MNIMVMPRCPSGLSPQSAHIPYLGCGVGADTGPVAELILHNTRSRHAFHHILTSNSPRLHRRFSSPLPTPRSGITGASLHLYQPCAAVALLSLQSKHRSYASIETKVPLSMTLPSMFQGPRQKPLCQYTVMVPLDWTMLVLYKLRSSVPGTLRCSASHSQTF